MLDSKSVLMKIDGILKRHDGTQTWGNGRKKEWKIEQEKSEKEMKE